MPSLVSCLAWPFVAIWRFLAFVLALTGRLLALVLGFALLLLGILASLTGIGAVIGIPLAIAGLLLLARALL
jgi:membrane-bound ClpP family serine protease